MQNNIMKWTWDTTNDFSSYFLIFSASDHNFGTKPNQEVYAHTVHNKSVTLWVDSKFDMATSYADHYFMWGHSQYMSALLTLSLNH